MGMLKPGNYSTGKVVDLGGAYVFIPNNLSGAASATIINPGQGSFYTMCANLYSPLITQGTDQIVVIPKYAGYMYGENAMQTTYKQCMGYINKICNERNVSLVSLNTLGSSAGDRYSLKEFANACRDGVDNGYCVITGASTIQGANQAGQEYHYGPNWAFLSDKEYSYMQGRTVYVFEGKNAERYSYVQALLKHGVNVVLVECKAAGHDQLSWNPLKTNVFNLLSGDPEKFLSNNNYSFWRCVDPNKLVWIKMSDDEVREVSSTNYMEVLLEKCTTLEEFADRYRSSNNTTLASNLSFVSNSMSDLKGRITSHTDINYTKGSDNEAGIVGAMYSATNYYGAVTNVLYGNISAEADAVYAIANAIYQMDGCAAVIADETLTDGVSSLFNSPSLASNLEALQKTTSELVDTAKNAVMANGRYDELSTLLTNSVAEGTVGKISISSLESAINAVVPSLNEEVEKAQGLKSSVDEFMSGIGASNILQGGPWDAVKSNMEAYQNLLDCNMKAANFISDTIKAAMGVVVDYINGSSDAINAVAGTDFGGFVSVGELDDSKLPEIQTTLEEIATQIETLSATITEMENAKEQVCSTPVGTEAPSCTWVNKYSASDIQPYRDSLTKYETAQTALNTYATRLAGLAPLVENAQKMINDAISQVKNMYENPVTTTDGNQRFSADFKLDMSAYGFEKDASYYKNLIDDYHEKLNPTQQPQEENPDDEYSGNPDDYGDYGGPTGTTPETHTEEASTEEEPPTIEEGAEEEPGTTIEPPTEYHEASTASDSIVEEKPTEYNEVPTEEPHNENRPHHGGGVNKPKDNFVEPITEGIEVPTMEPNTEYYEEIVKPPKIVKLSSNNVAPAETNENSRVIKTMGVAAGVGVALGAVSLGAHEIIRKKEDEEDENKDYGFEK